MQGPFSSRKGVRHTTELKAYSTLGSGNEEVLLAEPSRARSGLNKGGDDYKERHLGRYQTALSSSLRLRFKHSILFELRYGYSGSRRELDQLAHRAVNAPIPASIRSLPLSPEPELS